MFVVLVAGLKPTSRDGTGRLEIAIFWPIMFLLRYLGVAVNLYLDGLLGSCECKDEEVALSCPRLPHISDPAHG